jgi:hypothetical protein
MVTGRVRAVSAAALRAVVRCGEGAAGVNARGRRARYFWRAVAAMSDAQRRTLLRALGVALDDARDATALRRVTLLRLEGANKRIDGATAEESERADAGEGPGVACRAAVADPLGCMLSLPDAPSADAMFSALLRGVVGVAE